MGAKTSIEWTRGEDGTPGATWNPLVGCTKVSPGCDNCYAETQVNTRFHPAALAKGGRHLEAFPTPFETVSLRPDRFLMQPLSWATPKRVFVNSLSDLFHADVPDEFIAEVWAVMSMAPQHTFQLLTKRHARMRSLTNSALFRVMVNAARLRRGVSVLPDSPPKGPSWPLRNVWLGVSVENQEWADIRIPALLGTSAAVRWISAEPLLGPVDLPATINKTPETAQLSLRVGGLDWVVVGGESGPGARPMHPDWARSLRDQCVAAGVPYLFKQYGNWAPVQGEDDWRNCRETDHHVRADGYHWPLSEPHGAENGTEVLMRNVGKKTAGRVLDGRTWDEYPVVGS